MRFRRPLAYHYISSFPLPESLPVLSKSRLALRMLLLLSRQRDWKGCVQDDIEDAGEEKVCVEDDVGHAQGGFVLKFPTRCFPLLPVLDPPRPLPCSHNLQARPLQIDFQKTCLSLLDLVKIVITEHEKEAQKISTKKNIRRSKTT